MHETFFEAVKKTATAICAIKSDSKIAVMSHFDCDGICSAALISDILSKKRKEYSLFFLPFLSKKIIDNLAENSFDTIIFLDMGSSQLHLLDTIKKNIIIIDHHTIKKPSDIKGIDNTKSIIHLNPYLYGIDGSRDISCSGVSYYVAKEIDKKTSLNLSHIAVIGAIGDAMERQGFTGLNKEILDSAIVQEKIIQKKTLNIFGNHTRPLYKAIHYRFSELFEIGSEDEAIDLLYSLKIPIKNKKRFITYNDLTKDQEERLIDTIRDNAKDMDNDKGDKDILGFSYTLPGMKKETALCDAREFATLLNACGRLDKGIEGVKCCIGKKQSQEQALELAEEYRTLITQSMEWIEYEDKIIKEEGYMIIPAKNKIPSSIIGTITSIISFSNKIKSKRFILGYSYYEHDDLIKASLRCTKKGKECENDLYAIMKEITATIKESQSGGHKDAAGALFPKDQEEAFLLRAKEVLKKYADTP